MLQAAKELAAALGARLVVVNAFTPDVTENEDDPASEEIEDSEKADALRRLQAAGKTVATAAVPAECRQEPGPSADGVLDEARKVAADFIVIGRSGRHDLRHRLHWNAGSRIVRLSPCPVLVVPLAASSAQH